MLNGVRITAATMGLGILARTRKPQTAGCLRAQDGVTGQVKIQAAARAKRISFRLTNKLANLESSVQ
jgi:hypothetical protein